MLPEISGEVDTYYMVGIFALELLYYFPALIFAAVIDEYQLYRYRDTFK